MKITKGIIRTGRRLISIFLVMVVSSMMFFSSPANAATFVRNLQNSFQFTFINHTRGLMLYDLKAATNGRNNIIGAVPAGKQAVTERFFYNGTLEQGNVVVIGIRATNNPGFRFWSGGLDSQYINLIAGNGYRVTKDTSEISELTGNGFRVTVDAGGKTQTTEHIYIQAYNA